MSWTRFIGLAFGLVAILLLSTAKKVQAVNVVIDYTYDSNNYFGAGNPAGANAGAQARAAMEFAADYFSDIVTDTLSAIETPPTFNSQVFNGSVSWDWQMTFDNPSTDTPITLTNPTIAEDEYRVYVGARPLAGSTIGLGGPGGWGWSSSPSGGFTSSEINQINQISDDFGDAVSSREETSGFASWGGVVTFDTEPSVDWHYDHLSAPSAGETDFLSTAIHELAHVFGFGVSSEWNAWVSGSYFTGPQSVAVNGGIVPIVGGHWGPTTSSVVFGTDVVQDPSLQESSFAGTRQLFTALDAAALEDIGWDIQAPITFAAADFDTDGDVDSADLATLRTWYGPYTNGDADGDGDTDGTDALIWQRQYTGTITPLVASVPEPTSIGLIGTALASASLIRRRR